MKELREACDVLVSDGELLGLLLARNKSQHRRTGYFRALLGVAAALKRLGPVALPSLAQRAATSTTSSTTGGGGGGGGGSAGGSSSSHARAELDDALVGAAELTMNLRRASRALRQQVAAGYFLALAVAWLAIVARLLAAARTAVLRLLPLRRSISVSIGAFDDRPRKLTTPPLAGALEWLVAYPEAAAAAATAAAGNPSSSTLPARSERNGHGNGNGNDDDDNGDDDIGESVVFSSSSSSSNSNSNSSSSTPPPPVPSSLSEADGSRKRGRVSGASSTSGAASSRDSRVLLAADYSDSDDDNDDGNDGELDVDDRKEEALGWCLDTRGSGSGDKDVGDADGRDGDDCSDSASEVVPMRSSNKGCLSGDGDDDAMDFFKQEKREHSAVALSLKRSAPDKVKKNKKNKKQKKSAVAIATTASANADDNEDDNDDDERFRRRRQQQQQQSTKQGKSVNKTKVKKKAGKEGKKPAKKKAKQHMKQQQKETAAEAEDTDDIDDIFAGF